MAPSVLCRSFTNGFRLLMENISMGYFLVKLFLLKWNRGQGEQELPVLVQLLSTKNFGLQSCPSSLEAPVMRRAGQDSCIPARLIP